MHTANTLAVKKNIYPWVKSSYENLISFKNLFIYHHDHSEFLGYIKFELFTPLFSRWGFNKLKEYIRYTESEDYNKQYDKPNTRRLPDLYEIDGVIFIKDTLSHYVKSKAKTEAKDYQYLLVDAPKPIFKASYERVLFYKSKDRLLGGLFDI